MLSMCKRVFVLFISNQFNIFRELKTNHGKWGTFIFEGSRRSTPGSVWYCQKKDLYILLTHRVYSHITFVILKGFHIFISEQRFSDVILAVIFIIGAPARHAFAIRALNFNHLIFYTRSDGYLKNTGTRHLKGWVLPDYRNRGFPS